MVIGFSRIDINYPEVPINSLKVAANIDILFSNLFLGFLFRIIEKKLSVYIFSGLYQLIPENP